MLKRRIIIVTISVSTFILATLLIMWSIYGYFAEHQQSQLKFQTSMIAQGVAHEGEIYLQGLELGNYRVTWIAADGTVKFDSQENKDEMENHLERQEVRQAFTNGYGESTRYSATMLERMLYSAYRLPDGTVVRLSVPQNTIFAFIIDMAIPVAIVILLVVTFSVVVSSKETKLANQEEIEAMRREFTANVSHELKTPLHSISGYAELMKSGMVMAKDMDVFADKIYTEAQRMIHLIQDVITLSRLDEGRENMTRSDINLYKLAEEVQLELESLAQKHEVVIELIGKYVITQGIPQLMHGMVYNICENAIKYNKPGGNVVIEVEKLGGHPQISVRDSGIGIPKKDRGRIFERFYRVDKSHSKAVGGTGLGLSIVKHAAKLHNAKIEVDSVVGEGTLVTVRF